MSKRSVSTPCLKCPYCRYHLSEKDLTNLVKDMIIHNMQHKSDKTHKEMLPLFMIFSYAKKHKYHNLIKFMFNHFNLLGIKKSQIKQQLQQELCRRERQVMEELRRIFVSGLRQTDLTELQELLNLHSI